MAFLKDALHANPMALTLAGLTVGFLFGAMACVTNFCVMGAVSDWRTFGDKGRLGAAALAAAVAIAGAQMLHTWGAVDLDKSMYLSPRINWAGALSGGLLFGFGMVRAGGCASRNLIRAGAGDLRSLMTLAVLSIMAFATLSGVLGPVRNAFENATVVSSSYLGLTAPSLTAIAAKFGLSPETARVVAALAIALPLLLFAVLPGQILARPRNLIGGTAVGILVTLGWLMTGLSFDDMDVHPVLPSSLSFVKPVGDAFDWVQRSTALGWPGFGAATVFGALAGSFAVSRWRGHLRFSGFANRDDLVNHLSGAVLMGIGGVLGLGCSIGQGITGLSTLSLQSLIAAAAILCGAVLGMKRLERRV